MNLSAQQTRALTNGIMPTVKKYGNLMTLAIAPSFPMLQDVLNISRRSVRMQVCAQDCFWEQSGAYTGEVSPDMLAEMGCTHVLIGHSERRIYLHETDAMIQKKLACIFAMKKNIIPVLCVGETTRQKKAGRSEEIIHAQLTAALAGITLKSSQKLVIAYEPVWAIGSGIPMTPDEFGACAVRIRGYVSRAFGGQGRADSVVLYGGSVTPETARAYVSAGGDGVLVGGASQRIDSCTALIRTLCMK